MVKNAAVSIAAFVKTVDKNLAIFKNYTIEEAYYKTDPSFRITHKVHKSYPLPWWCNSSPRTDSIRSYHYTRSRKTYTTSSAPDSRQPPNHSALSSAFRDSDHLRKPSRTNAYN